MAVIAADKDASGAGTWVVVGRDLPIATTGLYRAKVHAGTFPTTVDFVGTDDGGTTSFGLGTEATGIDANKMVTLFLAPGEGVNISVTGTPTDLYAELEPINT